MSDNAKTGRPYKVTTTPVIGKTVVADDRVQTKLDVLQVLPPKQQGAIMADILRERGFSGDGNSLSRERSGVRVEIDTETGNMEVSVTESADLPPPPSNPSPCGCRIAARLKEAEDVQDDLQKKVTARLEGALSRLGCEMEGVTHQTTKKALIVNAAGCGQIKSVEEDKSGVVTITVEV